MLAGTAALTVDAAVAQDIVPPPPLKPGMAWSYRQWEELSGRDMGLVHAEVVAVASDQVTVRVTVPGEQTTNERWDTAGNWQQVGTQGWAWLARLAGPSKRVEFVPALALYRFPLPVGKSWVESARAVDPDTRRTTQLKVFAKALSWEEVNVPAGKFNAVKVRRSIAAEDAEPTRSGTTVTLIDWYAPQAAGPVKRICTWEHNDYRRPRPDQLVRGPRIRLELAQYVSAQ